MGSFEHEAVYVLSIFTKPDKFVEAGVNRGLLLCVNVKTHGNKHAAVPLNRYQEDAMSTKRNNEKHKDTDNEALESATKAVGHLHEAKERLKDAVGAAGSAVRSATSAAAQVAREEAAAGGEAVAEPLHEAAEAGRQAAAEARAAANAEVEQLLDKGRDLWGSAQGVIRQHPAAAFGAAFAVGWLVARLARRN